MSKLLLAKTGRVIMALFAVSMVYFATTGSFAENKSDGHKSALDTEFDMAPPFDLPTPQGDTVSLASQKGKWVFVNFWATWCPPCVEEMPAIERLSKKMKDRAFTVLAVHIGKESNERLISYAKKTGLTFTMLIDAEKETMRDYGLKSIPVTYIVNPKGEIVAFAEGMREWDNPEMVKYLEDLMDDFG